MSKGKTLTLEGDQKESFIFLSFKKAAGFKSLLADKDSLLPAADQHKVLGLFLTRMKGRWTWTETLFLPGTGLGLGVSVRTHQEQQSSTAASQLCQSQLGDTSAKWVKRLRRGCVQPGVIKL